jgi:hypothetical protein
MKNRQKCGFDFGAYDLVQTSSRSASGPDDNSACLPQNEMQKKNVKNSKE